MKGIVNKPIMGPTIAYISHDNLRHNINLIRQAVGSRKIMAVVKANAYGHGDIEISKTVIEAGCEYLGVAFAEEGIKLREAGITTPILVFGAHLPQYLEAAIDYKLEITITSEDHLSFLKTVPSDKSGKIPVHLKVDTGMNRVGFHYDQFENVFNEILKNPNIEIKGVYSHLSTSDDRDQAYAHKQISRLSGIVNLVKSKCQHPVLAHLANSGAIMKLPEAHFDMVRPGIMLYGQPPSPDFDLDWDLKEVLSLRSKLGSIKHLKKNEPVSYNRRFYTEQETFIGVIPAGYADGLSRKLTNKAEVLINNKRYPLVGTVCMDMVMVNLGQNLTCKTGDEVIFYGWNSGQKISVREISEKLHTIPYEITCNVSARVPRIHLS